MCEKQQEKQFFVGFFVANFELDEVFALSSRLFFSTSKGSAFTNHEFVRM